MRKKVIAGNWKMNNDATQSAQLIAELLEKLPQTQAEVVIAPSFVNLALAVEKTKGSPIIVAAQNMHFAEKGAFTGEVSASMLESIGVKTTILGHSERREYFNETDESLTKKVDTKCPLPLASRGLETHRTCLRTCMGYRYRRNCYS